MKTSYQSGHDINLTHLELGLFEVSRLMKSNLSELPQAFDLIAQHINADSENNFSDRLMKGLPDKIENKVLVFCGYEMEMLDFLVPKFQNVVVVPNDIDVDFERIKANYSDHPNFRVFRPTKTADIVSPDTIIVVPIYPLDDGTLLAYNYPSKLLTREVKSSSYSIIGIEVCAALPIQYGYEFSGLTSVLSPVNPANITHFNQYKI